MGMVASTMALPNPFHLMCLTFCHMVVLVYASLDISYKHWQGMGMLCTYLVHLIAELTEEESTATLYFHGWSHHFFNSPIPVDFSDEAGERGLRPATHYAAITSTQPQKSIEETLTNELYRTFVQPAQSPKPNGSPNPKWWHPVQRCFVLESCIVNASDQWHKVFQRVLKVLFQCQATGDCFIYMHVATESLKVVFPKSDPEIDIYCVCGQCGEGKSGRRKWEAAKLEVVVEWKILSLVSLSKFARRKLRRQKRQGEGTTVGDLQGQGAKGVGGQGGPPGQGVVAEDSNLSFEGEVSDHPVQRQLPMRKCKQNRVSIVDSDICTDMGGSPRANSCNSSNSDNSTSSSSSSDGSSSSSSSSDSSKSSGDTSGGGSDTSSVDSLSSASSPAPNGAVVSGEQARPTKFRKMGCVRR